MRVWTIQSTRAFVKLNKDGVLYCDASSEEGKASLWMIGMMEKRIPTPHPEDVKSPIWAKAQVGSYKKNYNPSGKDYTHGKDVLLVMEVPEEEILLFDSDMWNSILNGSLDGSVSWERIFDLNYKSKQFPRMKRNKNINAAMWFIKSEWVRGYRML